MPSSHGDPDKVPRRIAYVLLTLCALFLYGAAWAFSDAREKLESWERAEAEVVAYEYRKHRSRRFTTWRYHPRFLFSDAHGGSHLVTDDSGTKQPKYARGSNVPILYPVDDPQKAEIHCFSNLYTLCLVLAAFGSFTGLLGSGFYYVSRKHP